ncbi:hypothetical protein ACS0TY_035355 [Phlomoides rotata]
MVEKSVLNFLNKANKCGVKERIDFYGVLEKNTKVDRKCTLELAVARRDVLLVKRVVVFYFIFIFCGISFQSLFSSTLHCFSLMKKRERERIQKALLFFCWL